jgi:hypothetical protein
VELQTGTAEVRMDRMSNLLRADLVFCESVESRASRGKLLQRKSVALLVTVRQFLAQRSSEPIRRPKYCMSEAQGAI